GSGKRHASAGDDRTLDSHRTFDDLVEDVRRRVQDLLDTVRDALQVRRVQTTSEPQGQYRQCGELGAVGLGRGDRDLVARPGHQGDVRLGGQRRLGTI